MGMEISAAEEAKARAFREQRLREHAAAFEKRFKLLSEVSGIITGTTERPAPVPPEAAKRLTEIAREARRPPRKEGGRA